MISYNAAARKSQTFGLLRSVFGVVSDYAERLLNSLLDYSLFVLDELIRHARFGEQHEQDTLHA